ncbi:MAG: hypothetical protein M3Q77_03050 [Thermoproteota archaeon]|nr:hypothetical protein [Thermoproteota archaeon]
MFKKCSNPKEDFQKTVRQDYNEFADKLIRTKLALYRIHKIENRKDEIGVALCKSDIDKMRNQKTCAMPIWIIGSSCPLLNI